MEIKTESAAEQLLSYRPASLERLSENRSGQFASLLNAAITQTEKNLQSHYPQHSAARQSPVQIASWIA